MPTLLIDVTRLVARLARGRHPTGVDRVGIEYVRQYGARALAVLDYRGRSVVLSPRSSGEVFRLVLSGARVPLPRWLRVIGAALAQRLTEPEVDGAILLNTGHRGLEHAGYAERLRRGGVRCVFVLHDLIPITHPEYCRAGEAARHRTRLRNAFALADGLVAVSRATASEVSAAAAQMGMRVPPLATASLGSPLPSSPPAVVASGVAAPFFLIVGTIEARKNHAMLLAAWRRIVERAGAGCAPRLVIVGQRGWECEGAVDLIERCEQLRGVVHEVGDASDADLLALMARARALLFPSFAEGFGLPLVEALCLGTPVIASDLGVFREIAGDVPDYLDPLDAPSWIARIEEYASPSSAGRAAQLGRMARFRPPTWADHFARVDALLDEVDRHAA